MTVATDYTFLFADLAGFTALTEAHGDEQSADLAAGFFESVDRLLPEYGGEQIKTIGDAVMVRCDDAASAVRFALRVVDEVGSQHGFPSIRVGMATGPATERAGDWFGATVNTAARVAGVASGGEIVLTRSTRDAVGDVDDIDFEERGERELKNVAEPVPLYAARLTGDAPARALPIDPVCRMAVVPEQAAGTLTHDGVEYHFCSLKCAEAFAADPERYAGA